MKRHHQRNPRLNLESVNDRLPRWNAAHHTLYCRGREVKHFKAAAPNQETILAAFETARWRRCIEFQFPNDGGRNSKQRLRDAIHDLNRSLRSDLHFSQEGGGSRIAWCMRKKRQKRRLSAL